MHGLSHARGRKFRWLAAALGWLAAAALEARADPPTVEFDIPAGSLADSLDQFGEQSGLQVVYDYSLIGERRTPAVEGAMPPPEAAARRRRVPLRRGRPPG